MTITRVQGTGAITDNASSHLTPSITVSVGSLICVTIGVNEASPTFVAGNCTKSSGTATIDTPTLDKAQVGTGQQTGQWSALVTGAGTLVMAIATPVSTYSILTITEASGSWDSSRVEASNGANATTSTTPSSGNATSAGAALFIGALAVDNGAAITLTPGGSGWANTFTSLDGTAHEVGAGSYKVGSSGATEAATWTISAAPNNTATSVVAYKEAGAPPPPPPPPPVGTLSPNRPRPGRGPYSLGRYFRPIGETAQRAALASSNSVTTSLGAAVQVANTAAASLQAAVQFSPTATTSLGAAVQLARTVAASIDTAVQIGRTASASLDLALQQDKTAAASLDTYIQSGNAVGVSLDAAVQQARTAATSLSAAIQVAQLVSASMSAAISAPMSAAASLSAYVLAGPTATAFLDAAILRSAAASVAMSAYIQINTDEVVTTSIPRLAINQRTGESLQIVDIDGMKCILVRSNGARLNARFLGAKKARLTNSAGDIHLVF